jgi:hypothetical protein
VSGDEQQDGLVGELLRWGLKADTLNAEANRGASELEERLRTALRAVAVAIDTVSRSRAPLEPCAGQTQRIAELAQATAESTTRADLLSLNFQVEAARLEDDRGLDGVALEIRSLADRGTRSAAEIDELAASLQGVVEQARQAWANGQGALERAAEDIERALRAAEVMGRSLAEARSAMAQFSSGAQAVQGGPHGDPDLEAAARLAAAADVRGDTIERLTRAVATGLHTTNASLELEAARASRTAALVESFQSRLAQVVELVRSADEIARRAKQLAINADLATARSDDPAFGLFAEEARRLSEHAEETATLAQSHLSAGTAAHAPAVDACRELSGSIQALARDLSGLLARFDEGAPGEGQPRRAASSGRLGEVFRVDRAAAQELAQARASWRQLRGEEPGGTGD